MNRNSNQNEKTRFNIFTIVSEPRTGSNYLVSVLSSEKNVICHAEVFHPDAIYAKLPKSELPNIKERDASPVDFLDTVFSFSYDFHGHPKLIGFKYFFNHNKKIRNVILERAIPVILLERNDKLSQYSSAKIANKTGYWTSYQQGQHPISVNKVKFSFVEFTLFILRSYYRFNKMIKLLKRENVRYIHCYYEDIVKSNGVNPILEFLSLGEEIRSLGDHYKKQNTNKVLQRFSNPRYVKFIDSIFSIIEKDDCSL